LEAESRTFCEKHFREFHGIMFQKVENLKSEGSGFPTDAIYTPIKDRDEAHSDFVIFRASEAEHVAAVRDWLQDFIQYVRPGLKAVCAL
jgi:hypothetical protein